ncbi:AI-2E family transporter [Patescibacteria group bacterium]|nr:AI-2E family transporter [Patescibacteria group bacterium]MBU1721229.1 AI-2E family transporter [Patescibacteria group bacterium]MBU1901063.1 AI-2E family transporter [Patescibacteria group bacterium]
MLRKTSFQKMRSIFFFSLLILLGVLSLVIMQPFAYPIFWAAVIAIMFHPVYKWIDKHIKLPGISSSITVIIVVLVIFLPLVLLSALLIRQSTDIYQQVTAGDLTLTIEHVMTQLSESKLAPLFTFFQNDWANYATEGAKQISLFIFNNLKVITQNSFMFLFLSAAMLYTLYFFLKDGEKVLQKIMYYSPLGNEYEHMLYERFTSTSRATLKSTLILGGIQGTLGGLLFLVTGVEGAFIWGVIMTVLSVIPALGSVIVWLPAGIIMLALGNTAEGLIILLFGSIVISNIDNVLRPIMVGKDTQLHPLLVLFSTLGGIFFFGVSGFIIGPIVVSLFLAILSIYDHHYAKDLKKNV